MITILRLSSDRGWSADHHDVSFDEGFARAAATMESGGLTYVFDRATTLVVRIDQSLDGDCLADEARTYHLIRLHERLTGGEPLYVFTVRSIALERVLAVVDARWPVAIVECVKEVAE